ncbi:MAG: hypothetical protein ACLP1X_22820, partial [Polyangiaceae bacterium]
MTTASPVPPSPTASAMVVSPDGDALPLRAAARAAGVSESTLRRLVQDGAIEAIRDAGGTLRVTQSTVLELRTGGGLKRGPSLSVREAERARGALAAQVFALLRSKAAPDEIVERLETDPATVRALCEEWAKCRSLGTRLFAEPPPAAPAIPAWD